MVNVLIATQHDDPDTAVVANELRSRGSRVSVFHGQDYPMKSEISTFIESATDTRIMVSGAGADLDLESFDVVWWRRYHGFNVSGNFHPDDEKIIRLENSVLSRHFPHLVAPGARWINSPEGEMLGSSKMKQLRAAKDVGLKFPKTLATNSRAEASRFIDLLEGAGKRAILKTFLPHYWLDEADTPAYAYTSAITSSQLVEDSMFRVCPVILQERLDGVCEIRAVFMGQACAAVEHNHASSGRNHLDARTSALPDRNLKLHALPAKLVDRCVKLMESLSLVFGSFDFLLMPDGEYVFLEINPQGQWVWLDSECKALNLVSAFCDFIEHGTTTTEAMLKR